MKLSQIILLISTADEADSTIENTRELFHVRDGISLRVFYLISDFVVLYFKLYGYVSNIFCTG